MKKSKISLKILAHVLAICLVISSFNIPAYAEMYKPIIGYEIEVVHSYPGFAIAQKYDYGGFKYLVLTSDDSIKITDFKGNLIGSKYIGSGFEYIGASQDKIGYRLGNNFYRASIYGDSTSIIASGGYKYYNCPLHYQPKYHAHVTMEGMYVIASCRKVRVRPDSCKIFEINVKVYDIHNGSLQYTIDHNFDTLNFNGKYCEFRFYSDGWYVMLNNIYEGYNYSGDLYFLNKNGNLYGPYHWNEGKYIIWKSYVTPAGIVATLENNKSNCSYLQIYSGSEAKTYYWDHEISIKNNTRFIGDPAWMLVKKRGTNAGSVYQVENIPDGDDLNNCILYEDDNNVLVYGLSYLRFYNIDNNNEVLKEQWIKNLHSYENYEIAVDKTTNKAYIEYKHEDGNIKIAIIDLNIGKALLEGNLSGTGLPTDFGNFITARDGYIYSFQDGNFLKIKFHKPAFEGEVTNKITTVTPSTNWYRFAVGQDSCSCDGGLFKITYSKSGKHGNMLIWAGVTYGQEPVLSLISRSSYNDGAGIKKIRLLYKGTYDQPFLEFYCDDSSVFIEVEQINASSSGWKLVNSITCGSVPSDYTSKELNPTGKIFTIVSSKQFTIDRNADVVAQGSVTTPRVSGVSTIEQQLGDRDIILDDGSNPTWQGKNYGTTITFQGDGSRDRSLLKAGGMKLSRDLQVNGNINGRNIVTDAQNILPVIYEIRGKNGANCTTTNSFTLLIDAAPNNVQYRVTCGFYDSGWKTSNTIAITGLSGSGLKAATVQVKNTSGNIAERKFEFFKL